MLGFVGRRLVALVPVLFGISLLVFVLTAISLLLVGAPLTETVFAWPGLERMLVTAVTH